MSVGNRCKTRCQSLYRADLHQEILPGAHTHEYPPAHKFPPLTQASSFLITVLLFFFVSGVVSIVQDRAISANMTESLKILLDTWDNDSPLPQVITDHIIGCGSQLEPCQRSF